MKPSNKSTSTKRQADDYIRMGALLRKDRPQSKKKLVDNIVNSRLSLKQKISKIESIDSDSRQNINIINEPEQEFLTHKMIRRNWKRIKAPINRVNILKYLFQIF